ncbi:hypothetical protein MNAN1_002858 [Malassezia nana]|uniref:CUE domain-containing protein n=1 Tax=Malassezia nana TaxID=180528 RepID=A0AAF0EK61_9BASI|nr:hypothetical protein MNAN1_002858 [Malassezia nana]
MSMKEKGKSKDQRETRVDEVSPQAKDEPARAESNKGTAEESTPVEQGQEDTRPSEDDKTREKGSKSQEKEPEKEAPLSQSNEKKEAETSATSQADADVASASTPLPSSSSPPPQHDKTSMPSSSESQREYLQSMFPAFHKITISDILKARRNNMESAIQFLLDLSDPGSGQKNNVNTGTDAQMAQLLQERERYRAQVMQMQARDSRSDMTPQNPPPLRYSPRVRHHHGRPSATPHTPAGPPPPLPSRTSELSVWPTSEETRQWKEDLNRFTEEAGLAKVGTTLSNLRQKAETALRQHDGQGRMNSPGFFRHRVPTAQVSNIFQQDMQGRANGHTWSSSNSFYRTAPLYDDDPKPVADEELDGLVKQSTSQDAPPHPSALPRPPSKDHLHTPTKSSASAVPAWGQRYSSRAQSTTSEAKEQAISSKTTSKPESEAHSMLEAKTPESKTPSTSQSQDAQTTPTLPSKGPSTNNDTPVDKEVDSRPSEPDDEDFVDNPFDDDD